MDWFTGLSDDVKALLGCAAALLFCGTVMSLSYYIGKLRQPTQQRSQPQLRIHTATTQTAPHKKPAATAPRRAA